MDPGRLDKRVTIQSRSTSLDAYGQQVDTWVDVLGCWANIRPIGGSERLQAKAVESQLTHTVAVRYNPLLMPPTTVDGYRLLYGSRIFNIKAGRDLDEAQHWIILDCTEGTLNGQ